MNPAWRRHGIGIIAVAMFLTAAILTIGGWEGSGYAQFANICWRLSAVLALWWLAFPELSRLPASLWLVLPTALVAVAMGPKRLFTVAIVLIKVAVPMTPLLIALWFLWRIKPRAK